MKISCTKVQKEMLIYAMQQSPDCLFPGDINGCGTSKSCNQCIAENIEWQIEDGDGDGNY